MGIGLPQLNHTFLAGQYDAIIGVLAMPNAQVSQMLPSGGVAQLAAQAMTGAGTHPVVFLFGEHDDAHISSLPWSNKEDYLEAIVGIPYVDLVAGPGSPSQEPLYYLPRLYLDKLWPVAGGVFWYGFAKEVAKISS